MRSPLNVPENSLSSLKVILSGVAHVLASLLNSKGKIRPSKCKALQNTNQASIGFRIRQKWTIIWKKMLIRRTWCFTRLAISPCKLLKQIRGIFCLMHKKTRRGIINLKTKVLEIKIRTKKLNK